MARQSLEEQKVSGDRVFNFSAGPSALPLPVLEKAREELLNFKKAGMSVMEMSHRSAEFEEVNANAEALVRQHMRVPDDYAVIFLQGGASLQFAMAPMNLSLEGKPVGVIHTGLWTRKAMDEIKKITQLHIAASSEAQNFMRLPKQEEIRISPEASYVHIASNNTIYGTQWQEFPDTGKVPLVADMSSDILSREINVSRFGMIFAGAQKNLGPSGVAVIIIRKDLAERVKENVPTFLQYRTHIKNQSLYHTPPTFAVYMVGLVMEWIGKEGGVSAIQRRNEEKAQILYDAIDSSAFYTAPVEKSDRSRMNVVFRVKKGDEELESRFAKEAEGAGLSGLKGHRSVGGLRASIYNAQTLEGVRALVGFMKDFEKKHG